jgi:membrane protein implicated in regulation of membrane protease activity
MSDIDWPLAIVLGVVFVVMSVMRWRYFRRRWNRKDMNGER